MYIVEEFKKQEDTGFKYANVDTFTEIGNTGRGKKRINSWRLRRKSRLRGGSNIIHESKI